MNNFSAIERELLSGKTVISFTSGDSMQPLLYNRSTCVVIIRADKELKKNDLPLYKRPDRKLVMHRIIKVDSNFYYTRGDNRCGLEKVPKNWVLGIVTEIQRKGRTIKVTDKNYLRYVHFWNLIYPVRSIWYKIRTRLKKLKN